MSQDEILCWEEELGSQGDTVIRTVIGCHPLRIHIIILLPPLPFPSKMAALPRARSRAEAGELAQLGRVQRCARACAGSITPLFVCIDNH